MNCKIAVFDLETTGHEGQNVHKVKIVEIGIAVYNNGKIIKKFHQLINPERSIPAASTAIHQITNRMVKNKPTIKEIKHMIKKIFSKVDHILTQNGSRYDIIVLKNELGPRIINMKKHVDLLRISTHLDKKLKGHGLKRIKSRYGIKENVSHRALPDAISTYKCLRKMFAKHGCVCVEDVYSVFRK